MDLLENVDPYAAANISVAAVVRLVVREIKAVTVLQIRDVVATVVALTAVGLAKIRVLAVLVSRGWLLPPGLVV